MTGGEEFRKALEKTLEAIDDKFIPKPIGNGWYAVEGMGLVCNNGFLDEVDRVIVEEVKLKR